MTRAFAPPERSGQRQHAVRLSWYHAALFLSTLSRLRNDYARIRMLMREADGVGREGSDGS